MHTPVSWKCALAVAAALVLSACGGGGGGSSGVSPDAYQAPLADPSPRKLQSLNLPDGPRGARIDATLARASGSVEVWVNLTDAPVAAAATRLAAASLPADERAHAQSLSAFKAAPSAIRSALHSHRAQLLSSQDSTAGRLRALGATELGRVTMAHNAIAVQVDASRIAEIAALPGVTAVRRVVHHKMSLSETVPYIGASAVHVRGFDGTGVRVAVLDSGIDYTHRNLGGPGTAAAYERAWGTSPSDPRNTTVDPTLFPTAKVIGGYDFVGEAWPLGPRTEDPNPIDFGTHGTHVADIIGGRSLDGTHKGVAPGAQLVAVKVCSAVATSCNGIALLKGMDYALDPNGDGDPSDAVDVINLSLGSGYGQVEDDTTLAVINAVDLGVVVAVAAGNDENKPYIVSSPSIAPGAISVAQTAVPSDRIFKLRVNRPAAIAGDYTNTAVNDWAPIGAGFSGDVVAVGTACPEEAPLPASVAGKVLLIDRGTCSVSLKVDKAAAAGAIGVLLGLVADGDAVPFLFGGGTQFVPTLVIQQSVSQAIKDNIGAPVNVTVGPSTRVDLVGSMVYSSARGPSTSFQTIKPEIGAPGASVSAVAGSGDGQEVFGGTSGATPMVAGSAALLVQAFPGRTPLQIKSMLMNSASTAVFTDALLQPGRLAPISRIGAGEVRVDKALLLSTIAYNKEDQSAALSFGAREVSSFAEYEKKLVVENLSSSAKTYTIRNSFRYADDQADGAVTISAPSSVRVGARSKATVTVKLRVNPLRLPAWGLDGGIMGGDGDALDRNEVDGYLTLTSGAETLSVPWHILPRKAAEAGAVLAQRSNWPGGVLLFANAGLADSEFDVFSLTGTSSKVPAGELPGPGDSFAVIDMRAVGVRYLPAEGALQFAVNTFGRRAHPAYPGGLEIDIDTNGDGVFDFAVYKAELGGFAATGISVVYVADLALGEANAYYFLDADLNSGNSVLTLPLAALGVTPETQLNFTAIAYDNYFTGDVTDAIEGMRYTPATPRYAVVGEPSGVIRPLHIGRLDTLTVRGGAQASPSQNGFLLLMRRNAGKEAEVLVVR